MLSVRKPISSSIHNVSSLIPESRLPQEVLARGDLRGNEYAWRRTDLPLVFEAAQAAGLANLGGQVQFRFPDGICELYWQNFDVEPYRSGETWNQVLARTRHDAEIAVSRLPADDELVADGLAHFEFLREKAAAGIDIKPALCFVCYFSSE